MKINSYANGASVSMEKLFPSGMYCIVARSPSGEVLDKVRCDSYLAARAWFVMLGTIAKNS